MGAKQISDWLSSEPRLELFCEEGIVDDSFTDEWELYDLAVSHLNSIPNYISDNATISSSSEITGNVVIEDGAEILPFSNIRGPAYIGKNVVVGHFSFIRPYSFLSKETLMGNHSYCHESVTAPKCRASHHVGCCKSILLRNSMLSAFVLTATLRADHKPILQNKHALIEKRGCIVGADTYIAPHVTISPGVRVGSNCFIGSFLTVIRDISDRRHLSANFELIEKENTIQIGERKFSSVIDK